MTSLCTAAVFVNQGRPGVFVGQFLSEEKKEGGGERKEEKARKRGEKKRERERGGGRELRH